tara:strand:+ start:753 stop:2006 length:1254 start_codon:yes stop_codon:yes gene_type:complete
MIYTFKQKIIDTIIVFLLVMSTGGLLFVFNRNNMYLVFLCTLLGTIFFSRQQFKRRLFNSSITALFVLILLFWTNYSFGLSGQLVSKYLYYMVVLFVSALTFFHFSNNRNLSIFSERLYIVLKFLTIHAFFQALAYLFIGNNLQTIYHKEYECTTFNYLFYYASTEVKKFSEISLFGFNLMRNQGLFWEAGVAQLFLNMYFFLEAFVFKRNRLMLILAIIVIISTYSTIGIIILLIQMFYYAFFQNRSFLALVFAIVTFFSISSLVIYNIQEKTTGEKQASFQKRYFDLIQPFFIALDNPITGVGLDLYKFQEYRSEFYINSSRYSIIEENVGLDLKMETTEQGSSNSFMYILAAMGFPTGLFIIYLFFKQSVIEENKFLFLLVISLSLFSSPLLLRPFLVFLIFSGFVRFNLRFIR